VPELTQNAFNVLMGVFVEVLIAELSGILIVGLGLELIQFIVSKHCPKLIVVISIHILVMAILLYTQLLEPQHTL
jgi:hypothetical protein